MCLKETHSSDWIGKNLTSFLFWMAWNKETLYHPCFGICHQKVPREPGRTEIEWDISASGLCWWR
jgi:hypothetical protein